MASSCSRYLPQVLSLPSVCRKAVFSQGPPELQKPGSRINDGKDVNQFSSVTQSCPTLCNPMDCSTPGLPVPHQLPKFTQTNVHWADNAIQPSHPLSSPSPPAFNLSQHQRCEYMVTKVAVEQECMHAQSCLWDPMDYSSPGSSVHGILQVRILEWVVISSWRGSSWPRDRICVSYVFCISRWILYHWATL